MNNCTEVLNGPTGSAAILTWYQGNFTGVLNSLAGSEAMSGKRRDEEHTLDTACSKYKCWPRVIPENNLVLDD